MVEINHETRYVGNDNIKYPVGSIVPETCPVCGSLLAFLYTREVGYRLYCLNTTAFDHGKDLTPSDIE